eukprot:4771568-Pyramimonas_sp.AAC.1
MKNYRVVQQAESLLTANSRRFIMDELQLSGLFHRGGAPSGSTHNAVAHNGAPRTECGRDQAQVERSLVPPCLC